MTTEPTVSSPDAEPERDADHAFPIDDSPSSVHASLPASASPPRTRWAAIVWGLCFAAIAWFGIWMLSSTDRRSDVTDWYAALDPGTIVALALLSAGVVVLVSGLVGLIRHAQRRRLTARG